MKNYIVRNCPAILKTTLICNDFSSSLYTPRQCKDTTNCFLKRIAKICKAEKDKGFCMTRYGAKVPVSEGWDFASEILELLEIEEVDE